MDTEKSVLKTSLKKVAENPRTFGPKNETFIWKLFCKKKSPEKDPLDKKNAISPPLT